MNADGKHRIASALVGAAIGVVAAVGSVFTAPLIWLIALAFGPVAFALIFSGIVNFNSRFDGAVVVVVAVLVALGAVAIAFAVSAPRVGRAPYAQWWSTAFSTSWSQEQRSLAAAMRLASNAGRFSGRSCHSLSA
jgi:hypothetical protein